MAGKKSKIVTRRYNCPICKKTHLVKLNKNILNGHTKFPFPYVILHNFINNQELKEVLTILYIDRNCQIRHAEIQELADDNLFSKEQVMSMTKSLMEENIMLKEDIERLTKELNKLKKTQ